MADRRSTKHYILIVADNEHLKNWDILRSTRAQRASADNNTMKPVAGWLTPPRKPGITSGIFRPTRPSLSQRHSPRLLRQHPCWNTVKLRQKLQKVLQYSALTRCFPDRHRQHAEVPTTEQQFRAKKGTRDLWRAAFDQSLMPCKRSLVCSQSGATDATSFCSFPRSASCFKPIKFRGKMVKTREKKSLSVLFAVRVSLSISNLT